MRRARPLALAVLTLLGAGCMTQRARNLAAAQRALHQLATGMACPEACAVVGTTPPAACADWTYEGDFGRTFSRREYTLRMWIRGGRLVRADIVQPRYEGGARKGDDPEIIEEMGAPIAQIAGMASGG